MKQRRKLSWFPMLMLSLLAIVWMLDGWWTRSASAVQKSAEAQASQQDAGQGDNSEEPVAQQSDVDVLLEGLDLELPGSDPGVVDDVASESEGETPPLIGAYLAMREAGSRLTAGELGEETQAVQQRAIDLLDQLINLAQADEETGAAQSGASQSSPEQSAANGEEQSQAKPQLTDAGDEEAQDSGQPGDASSDQQDENSGQSGDREQQVAPGDENNSQGPGGDGEPEDQQVAFPAAGDAVPLDAAGQAVWGHLPKRARGLLRAETPTEYLPGYAEEISAYFRALAEMKPDER